MRTLKTEVEKGFAARSIHCELVGPKEVLKSENVGCSAPRSPKGNEVNIPQPNKWVKWQHKLDFVTPQMTLATSYLFVLTIKWPWKSVIERKGY
jgi:hypothetical protein